MVRIWCGPGGWAVGTRRRPAWSCRAAGRRTQATGPQGNYRRTAYNPHLFVCVKSSGVWGRLLSMGASMDIHLGFEPI